MSTPNRITMDDEPARRPRCPKCGSSALYLYAASQTVKCDSCGAIFNALHIADFAQFFPASAAQVSESNSDISRKGVPPLSTTESTQSAEGKAESKRPLQTSALHAEMLEALKAARPLLIGALAFVDCKKQLAQLDAAIKKGSKP